MIGLTPRQADCLRFIAGYQRAKGGVSPALSEIVEGLCLTASSKSVAHRLIGQLEQRGYVRRLPHRTRAIELLVHPAIPTFGDQPLFFIPVHDTALADGEATVSVE